MRAGKMLRQVLHSVVRKPATVNYPTVPAVMPNRFRGKLRFTPELCIGCKLCMKDCPSGAIVINKVGDKRFEAVIDLSRCVYCAQCVDTCPKKALMATAEFELAQLDPRKLKVTFHAKPVAVEPPQPAEKDAAEKPA